MTLAQSPKDTALTPPVRLAVVMPVFGNWGDTLDCLGMLAGQTSQDFRLLLADDGSPDSPPDAIHDYPFVTDLRKPHGGFASACNSAVGWAADAGCTHVLLLNNDTSFGPGFIEAWLAKAAAFPQAIMGPLIFYFDTPEVVWYSGGRRSVAVPFVRLRRQFTEQTPVDVLTGCVLLVPVQAWTRINGFDERYVTYYEDFDFMLKARDAGIPAYLVVEPELRVLHKVSRTALHRGRWNRDYRMIASRLLFIRRRYSGVQRVVCLCASIPHLALVALTNIPELPNPRLLWDAIRKGLTDDASGEPVRTSNGV
jgi:GT2 family glycosyltransferase